MDHATSIDRTITAVKDFTNLGQADAEHDALIVFSTHDTSFSPNLVTIAIQVNTLGQADSPAFGNLRAIPALDNTHTTTSLAAAAKGSKVVGGRKYQFRIVCQSCETDKDYSVAWYTVTIKNNQSLMRRIDTFHTQFVEEIKREISPYDFVTQMFFQPMPHHFAEISRKSGGNVLGFDRIRGNAILCTVGILTNSTDAVHSMASARLNKMKAETEEFLDGSDGAEQLVYLNYAGSGQDPLGSYGSDNVAFIRATAAKYDPTGAFQKHVPGGFKISRTLQ
jgi:hypothetical protein